MIQYASKYVGYDTIQGRYILNTERFAYLTMSWKPSLSTKVLSSSQ